MRKTTGTLLATLLLAATGGSALAAEVTVMISGGFKAALEKLAPAWEKQTGNHLVVIPGPSMGKTPQAIPNRLARGEHADVVIMVGDALTSLEKAGRTQPGSRRELADSPIGVVVKAGAPLPAIHSGSLGSGEGTVCDRFSAGERTAAGTRRDLRWRTAG